ncbi:RNA polymerase sigma factor (plasmid) [Bacillus cereus]|nr:RNA polymerase sigma factor [Bacillus cereus]
MASNDNISNWIDRLLSGDEEDFEYIFDLTIQ